MRVEVTQALIDRAIRADSRHCMIADAIMAKDPVRYHNVSVDVATMRWTDKQTGKRHTAITPTVAAQRLIEFDQGENVEPFAFVARPVVTQTRQSRLSPPKRAAARLKKSAATRPKVKADGTVSGRLRIPRAPLSEGDRLYGRRLLRTSPAPEGGETHE
jgi:hypothetical protein